MEDEVVTEKDALRMKYLLNRKRINKAEWKKGWNERGVYPGEKELEWHFQKAREWFLAHPDYISPDVEPFLRSK